MRRARDGSVTGRARGYGDRTRIATIMTFRQACPAQRESGGLTGPPSAGPAGRAIMATMRYRRAIEKIRILAEACENFKRYPVEEPFLGEAYVFGDVLRGADPLDVIEVVLVI